MRLTVYAFTVLGLLAPLTRANLFKRNLAYDTPFVGRAKVRRYLTS